MYRWALVIDEEISSTVRQLIYDLLVRIPRLGQQARAILTGPFTEP
jgi:hypothetical protein